MGAQTFTSIAFGKTAEHAFAAAVHQARLDYGHSGYTGTIADKHSFLTIKVPSGRIPADYATELIDVNDSRISDKWGPAGCIALGEGKWLFFWLGVYLVGIGKITMKSCFHKYLKKAIIDASGSVSNAASMLTITRPSLSNILNGRFALSVPLALRIERVFGLNARKLLIAQLDEQIMAATGRPSNRRIR